jgi:hypothetical protein
MSEMTRDLFVHGFAAAKSGDNKEARFYFEWLLRLDPPMEERKEAWYWMSEISENPSEKRKWLEEILSNDLWDGRARRKLAVLDGKLKESEIIDPNRMMPQAADDRQNAQAQRFTCPKCGGRMTFTPDGQSLICDYCDSRSLIDPAADPNAASTGDDFIIGMATAKGHLKPLKVHTITCEGCGATFILPPNQLSDVCPYCQSSYVLDETGITETVVPNSLIPFQINVEEVKESLKKWFVAEKFEPRPRVTRGQAIYLPYWLFDIGGQISYKYQLLQGKRQEWIDQSDVRVVQQQNILIPASNRLPDSLSAINQNFDLSGLVPYEDGYLSNWIAENYQISMSDASLQARQQVVKTEKEMIPPSIEGRIRNFSYHSAGIQVESYQLILLPIWVTHYALEDQSFNLLINGQTGEVFAERPKTQTWLDKLLGEES